MRKSKLPNPTTTRDDRNKALAKMVADEPIWRGAQKAVADREGVSVFIVNRAWMKYKDLFVSQVGQ